MVPIEKTHDGISRRNLNVSIGEGAYHKLRKKSFELDKPMGELVSELLNKYL